MWSDTISDSWASRWSSTCAGKGREKRNERNELLHGAKIQKRCARKAKTAMKSFLFSIFSSTQWHRAFRTGQPNAPLGSEFWGEKIKSISFLLISAAEQGLSSSTVQKTVASETGQSSGEEKGGRGLDKRAEEAPIMCHRQRLKEEDNKTFQQETEHRAAPTPVVQEKSCCSKSQPESKLASYRPSARQQ